nr:Protein H04M03.12 [Haemonchus contortus]
MTINLSPPGPEQLAEDAFEAPKRDWHKRYSVPRRMSERRITVRPYESFRDRRENDKPHITYGYAALSTERKHVDDDEYNQEGCSTPPSPSTFSIYGDDPGPSSICEQPVGAQADIFIASLGDKNRCTLKKFLENSPRQENHYFMWIKDHKADKFTVISIKTLENHLKSSQRVRRVKWRQMSTERMSIYRYSLPAITYEKSKRVCECVMRRKKMWMIATWLTFILLLCVIVVVGSLSPEERIHPYLHYNASATQIALHNLRNMSIG